MLRTRRQVQVFAVLLAAFSLFAMAADMALSSGAVWPQSGDKVKKKDSLYVDCTHMEDGYILCKGKADMSRLKLRISYGDETFTYDLNTSHHLQDKEVCLGETYFVRMPGVPVSTTTSMLNWLRLKDKFL